MLCRDSPLSCKNFGAKSAPCRQTSAWEPRINREAQDDERGLLYFYTAALIWSMAFRSSAARSRKVCNGVEVHFTIPQNGNP